MAGKMDPATIAMITSALFGGLGGLLGGDEGQERRPFEGELEAQSLMDRGRNVQEGSLQAKGEQIGRGVHLRSAFAQTPPTYTGGGLPFPIGVNAQDPALADPNLLRLEGIPFNDMLAAWEMRPRGGNGSIPAGPGGDPGGSPVMRIPGPWNGTDENGNPPLIDKEQEELALQILGTR